MPLEVAVIQPVPEIPHDLASEIDSVGLVVISDQNRREDAFAEQKTAILIYWCFVVSPHELAHHVHVICIGFIGPWIINGREFPGTKVIRTSNCLRAEPEC